jgi:hypothetical protein
MQRLLILAILAAIGWYGYGQYQQFASINSYKARAFAGEPVQSVRTQADPNSRFKCDGRVYCSQMTSCEEAKFFLQNCPGTKMDGDGDGIPCEKQWCK